MSAVNEDLGLSATELTPPVGGSTAWLDLQDSSGLWVGGGELPRQFCLGLDQTHVKDGEGRGS